MRCLMNAWPTRLTSGIAAGALDRLRHGPARAHVVDHLRAGLLLEHGLGEQRRREVAGDELAGVVDEEAAVGVAVEGDAEVGALLERLADDELAVLGQQRVRLVVREAPVRLEVARDGVDRQPLEHRRQHRAGHPVRGVDDDAQRPDRLEVDEREHALDVRRPDVLLRTCPCGPGPGAWPKRTAARSRMSSRPESPPTGSAPRRTIFIPVYSFGLCEAVTVDAAVEPELADGEIEHLGADHADVDDVGARVGAPSITACAIEGDESAHVAPDRDPPGSNCST